MELADHGEALGAAIAEHARHGARLAVAVASFEAAGRHELDGARTMKAWLRANAGIDETEAARLCATGRRLRALPVVRAAVLDGVLSGGQLRAIVANVPTRHLERFADHEADIVPTLAGLDVDQTERALQAWRREAPRVQWRLGSPGRGSWRAGF